MKREDYKPLGQYIQLVDERNHDGAINNLVGVSFEKKIIPSIANTIGTDLSNYRVIKPGQFAYCPVTSRNGDRISIALYKGGDNAILSVAYSVFEITKVNELDADYLMLWLSRPEFDRYARFISHGSVRELFSWEDMCNVLLPVPSIEEQRRIVAEYQTVERRIKNNEAMIQKLEETAQAIYHHTFVEGIDENNLPEGWRMLTIKEFCKATTSGGTPNRSTPLYWNKRDYRWLKSGEVQNNVVNEVEEWISEDGLNNSSAKLIPSDSIVMAMYGATASQVAYLNCETTTNQACCNMLCNNHQESAYLYFALKAKQEGIKVLANGGAQENLSQDLIISQTILKPNNNDLLKPFAVLLDCIICVSRELTHLRKLQSLLTSKLA